MNQETKDKLKLIPKSKCTICGTSKSYTNPMAKCKRCGKKFCFDHINSKIEKDGVNDYCDNCLK